MVYHKSQMSKPAIRTHASRKAQSRKAMCDAMLELLEERSFDQIQITDLTARANVGYATFFRHFQSLSDVLEVVAGEEIHALMEMSIPLLFQSDSSVSTLALCRYVAQRKDIWRTLLTGGAAHRVRGEFVRQARVWAAREEQRSGAVPIDLGTVCTAGATLDALAWWLERDGEYDVEALAQFIDRGIIAPFLKLR